MNTAAKAAIATLLGLAVLIAGFLLMSKLSSNKATKELQTIASLAANASTTEVPLDKSKLQAIFDHLGSLSFDKDKPALYKALSLSKATDGTDIDREIVTFATKDQLHEDIRVQLFHVLNMRKVDTVVPALIKYASKKKETKAAAAAIDAAASNITANEIPSLLTLISLPNNDPLRSAAEKAVRTYAEAQSETAANHLASQLSDAYDASFEQTAKESYLRLLGSTGSSHASKTIENILNGEQHTLKIAAYTALQNWPNDDLYELHLQSFNSEMDQITRTHALDTLLDFLQKSEGDNYDKQWKALALAAKDDNEKMKIIKTLGRLYKDDWAISIVEVFRNDSSEDVSFLAERALEKMTN